MSSFAAKHQVVFPQKSLLTVADLHLAVAFGPDVLRSAEFPRHNYVEPGQEATMCRCMLAA